MKHELLEEAVDLAVALVDAVLGPRKDEFGLREALHNTGRPFSVWLPYTYVCEGTMSMFG